MACQRWEYLVTSTMSLGTLETQQETVLAPLGADGWELVAVVSSSSNPRLVWKRLLLDVDPRLQGDCWPNASVETLRTIEMNECEYQPGSLSTGRFRRVFNELRHAGVEIK